MNEQPRSCNPDETYEWTYTVTFSRFWSIPIIIWKTIGIIAIVLWVVFFLFMLFFGNFKWEFILEFTSYLVFFGGCFAVLMGLIFLLVIAFYKGRMVYRLRMTPQEICLVQTPKEKKRDDLIATASVITGIATGNAGTTAVGAAMMSGSINHCYFSSVRKVRLYRSWDMINLTNGLTMFPVYVRSEDYDLVKDYIIAHLPEKRRKRYESKM